MIYLEIGDHIFRIKIFDLEGNHVKDFGEHFVDHHPTHVCCDKDNNIILIYKYKIQLYSPEGQFITELGKYGTEDGNFCDAFRACCDKDNNLFITDRRNNRIQVFQPVY